MTGTQTSADRSSVSVRGTRRRLRIWMLFLLGFSAWAGFTFYDQVHKLDSKMARMEELELKLADTRAINDAYKQEIVRLNDPEYIEQILRKDHLMTKEGEVLYIETK
ncbi:septum formation initiator family protein [Xylanibacillus composti]|uniref:Septum formation initiator family protein n=1 Tax=Xylanibacillus composti TaxID=1572762 RepID=A0A8J4H0E5_9BACL|nr:septum formation initiator family protein [Xylanibacillus composti]MDT9725136.1 septum formation initiator family protein [Xylanibacillus composti]GIQ67291.1 hypothetical protein XYCOK13_01150 [Xylanibacillus composti]